MTSSSEEEMYTTYSEDERIETYLRSIKIEENRAKEERAKRFRKIFQEKNPVISNLRGLKFKQCNSRIVKFSFEPSKICESIDKNIIFYCSFHYYHRSKQWFLKREPIPGAFMFYRLFLKRRIVDDILPEAIEKVYDGLKEWSYKYEQNLIQRHEEYMRGDLEYFELTAQDELLLTEEERRWVRRKRTSVLNRMIPPQKKGLPGYSELESSDSN